MGTGRESLQVFRQLPVELAETPGMPIANLLVPPYQPSPWPDARAEFPLRLGPVPPAQTWQAQWRGRLVALESIPNWELRVSEGVLIDWLHGYGINTDGMCLQAMQQEAREVMRARR